MNFSLSTAEYDSDEHYPGCPILADQPESVDTYPICDCDEQTKQIRAEFAEARLGMARCY